MSHMITGKPAAAASIVARLKAHTPKGKEKHRTPCIASQCLFESQPLYLRRNTEFIGAILQILTLRIFACTTSFNDRRYT